MPMKQAARSAHFNKEINRMLQELNISFHKTRWSSDEWDSLYVLPKKKNTVGCNLITCHNWDTSGKSTNMTNIGSHCRTTYAYRNE